MKKNFWENFANADAEYYILTENPYPSNTKEGKVYFFKSAEQLTSNLLSDLKEYIDFKGKVCEIGCGVGRLLVPHAKLFNKAIGVDISRTMLDKLMDNAKDFKVKNIIPYLPSEPWYNNEFAYVYSFIVFQHISNLEIIKDYILKIADSLQKNGIAKLHFDTRKQSFTYLLRNALPDFILPKTQRKGIRRIRRDPGDLKKIFNVANLRMLNESGAGSEEHIFILQKNF